MTPAAVIVGIRLYVQPYSLCHTQCQNQVDYYLLKGFLLIPYTMQYTDGYLKFNIWFQHKFWHHSLLWCFLSLFFFILANNLHLHLSS